MLVLAGLTCSVWYCTKCLESSGERKNQRNCPYYLVEPTQSKMSTALDKSLDDIISSSRKTKKVQANRKKTVGKAVGKGVGKAQKKQPVVTFKKSKPAAAPKAATPAIDLTYATKVVAHGLPRDLKQENVKVC